VELQSPDSPENVSGSPTEAMLLSVESIDTLWLSLAAAVAVWSCSVSGTSSTCWEEAFIIVAVAVSFDILT
jgi:hypothetical protein